MNKPIVFGAEMFAGADNTATDTINLPLSDEARAVKGFLQSQGVAASRLTEK